MRVVVGGLLALVVMSAVVSCRLDTSGLKGRDGGFTGTDGPGHDGLGDHAAGVAGTGAAGSYPMALAGQGGSDSSGAGGATGEAGTSAGEAGVSGGAAGTGAAGTGDAGTGAAGTGDAGTGDAGTGDAGTGAAGTGAAGTGAAGTGAAGTGAPSPMGCADGTREGFVDQAKYPGIAACAGAWQIPGLLAPNTRAPQCQRRGGNTGNVSTSGAGCSVADLCAEGWHVCESIAEFKTKAADCIDVLAVIGGAPNLFATRQRGGFGATELMCDAQNSDGANNVHGCGNIGSQAAKGCTPFTRMLRDSDCQNNPPWMCADSDVELEVVTKPGAARGGVLCCR